MSDLLISVGDYVIVQDGVIDQPKIIVWDNLSVTDIGTLYSSLFVNVFEAIVTEDPVQPNIIQTIALSVFDNVRVQDGQFDSDTVLPFVFEDIAITENTSLVFTRLNITANDVVTVIDSPAVLVTGSTIIAPIANDNVLVQEFLRVYLLLEINAFDNVSVVDGAREISAFDDVTVVEDITPKLARLLIAINDTVTVTESIEVFGPAIDIGAFVADDVILTESVTVLLTTLRPTAGSDVSMTDAVMVSLTSIALLIDLSDSVTVVENLETQTNPIQINEFTQIVVTEFMTAVFDLLKINVGEDITVVESIMMQLLPNLLDVNDSVTVTERVALRIGTGRKRKSGLLTVGAGE